LHAVSRSSAQCARSGRERLRRHRYGPQGFRAWSDAMTTTEVPRPSFWRRAWAFALEIWDVLVRPSSVFSLGFLVLAGIAGIFFWGAFFEALSNFPGIDGACRANDARCPCGNRCTSFGP